MDKEKEIEEMAKVLYGHYCKDDKCGECKEPSCLEYRRAVKLYSAGYGNVKQYQDEIEQLLNDISILQTELSHREEDLIHADENVYYREVNLAMHEKEIKIQAVKEFAENAVKPIIDELVELLFNDNESDCKVDFEK